MDVASTHVVSVYAAGERVKLLSLIISKYRHKHSLETNTACIPFGFNAPQSSWSNTESFDLTMSNIVDSLDCYLFSFFLRYKGHISLIIWIVHVEPVWRI
jgi:hypothetical protein